MVMMLAISAIIGTDEQAAAILMATMQATIAATISSASSPRADDLLTIEQQIPLGFFAFAHRQRLL